MRAYHQIQALSREHTITLLSLAETTVTKSERAQVAELCHQVNVVPLPRTQALLNAGLGVASRLPLQVNYYRSTHFKQELGALLARERFDAIHTTLIRLLPYVWGLRQEPVVVDLIDSLSLNLADRRKQVGGLKRVAYEMEYRRVQQYERAVVRRFPALVVSSAADSQALGGGRAAVIPNGVDMERFAFAGPEARDAGTLIFTGNMGYHPNDEAVAWFCAEVWPLLRASHPALRFQVVGTNPSERIRSLASAATGIEVLGKVPEVTSYLQKATVAVCPMRSGSGIQNKVIEAMSAGAPVVATGVANRGVRAVAGRDLLVADTARDFAHAATRLLDDAPLRAELGRAGREYVARHFRWEQHAQQLVEVYETVRRPSAEPLSQVAGAL
ncbi:MAG: glycosyltransferase [Chloroflexi bacterium]|nr:glycosyltransferase [Chloroflexota bacterium]